MEELSRQYNPKETEDKWYKLWEKSNLFSANPDSQKKPFCIVIPPPNVTGILHMGHALNNTIQDILIRYHRMKGEESLWMPGTDHAGIATQNVVEKAIAKEALKRQDLGREKFIERVWLWKEQYGSTIIKQLKKLGASCDWPRTRFTMDEEYSNSVIEAFNRLYEKGLIYQGSYIINWCPRCQTALSDEEAPHQEMKGSLYYLKYPIKAEIQNSCLSGRQAKSKIQNKTHYPIHNTHDYIIVATTRPETMLGDTAVAVNPKDKRYKKLIGKTLILPLINREIKIIADEMVDMKFGTGAVKVTPAHDPNDYALGKKHNLEFVNVMHPDGRMNEYAGKYQGLERFKARETILEDLRAQELLDKIEPHQLSAGHCYRCHTIIEPYLSKQWFVKMQPLAKPAIEAVKKEKIKFYPERWTKVYLNWMENIQDWCISRQIWWGHRIPVYYCRKCQEKSPGHQVTKSPDKAVDRQGIIVSRSKPEKCPYCGNTDIYQDEDVLDTWFSSWLWPFATFYWPFSSHQVILPLRQAGKSLSHQTVDRGPSTVDNEDLKYFYPTSVLVTAPEIIFFWVARMIMSGLEFMKDIPFRDVYIHGTVRDIEGKKMSKSLGNIIDPLDIINEYGTDALRFSLISITAQGQDVFLTRERFEQGRNFANKIWNASRFILMNSDHQQGEADLCEFFNKERLDIVNRWILSRFYSVLKEVEESLQAYRFNEAANALYGFFWHEFCDWYLEIIKPDIKNPHNQLVMHKILEKFLRAAHPFMPFITEEIWHLINSNADYIMVSPWPHIQGQIIDKSCEKSMEVIFEIITAIRNLRQDLEILPTRAINVTLATERKSDRELIEELSAHIKRLARLENLSVQVQHPQLKSTLNSVVNNIHISIPLEGLVDVARHRQKIDQKIAKASSEIISKETMLLKDDFIKRAPKDIVEKEKEKLGELRATLLKLKAVKDGLS